MMLHALKWCCTHPYNDIASISKMVLQVPPVCTHKKVMFLWTFSVRGVGAQVHSIAFRVVLPNFTEAIFGLK